jgi:hypothetical protein
MDPTATPILETWKMNLMAGYDGRDTNLGDMGVRNYNILQE